MSRPFGFHHTTETRKKMSKILKGRKLDSFICEKKKRKKHSEKTKLKLKESSKKTLGEKGRTYKSFWY